MAEMAKSAVILMLLAAGTVMRADDDPVFRVGNGVASPKVLHKVDPSYSREAEIDHIQGTALYRM
jgi:hypothetical protein